jgi:hypothetical protein
MAQQVRQVEHYPASIPNKVGEGARVLLREAGMNLIAFWGYQYRAGRGQLEFIPENGAAFVACRSPKCYPTTKRESSRHALCSQIMIGAHLRGSTGDRGSLSSRDIRHAWTFASW